MNSTVSLGVLALPPILAAAMACLALASLRRTASR